jgi:hypothetical protein
MLEETGSKKCARRNLMRGFSSSLYLIRCFMNGKPLLNNALYPNSRGDGDKLCQ